jgi:hypothetical protein
MTKREQTGPERHSRAAADSANPYATLPAPIRPDEMITGQATREPGDPTFDGRDPNLNWLLRYAG